MRRLTALVCATLAGLYSQTSPAQERLFENPALLPLVSPKAETGTRLMSVIPPKRDSREIVYQLDVDYIDSQLWNPSTRRYDKVRLRGYTGDGMDPGRPFVSPTIEMRPGQTVRMNLRNKLPTDPSCVGHDTKGHDPNNPHCFNGTNMHTHGLWINPNGNSDNVLISINPGVDFEYEYNVPEDHPAGTFWYHPHRHGSTALQVSSGMSGALIIRGDRQPTAAANGDLDVLLSVDLFDEKVMVFQQIAYACRDKAKGDKDGQETGPIKKDADGAWRCGTKDIGRIESYDGGQFGPGTWGPSGRYTSINGVVLPTFQARVGHYERWRMIHAGVRDTINVSVVKASVDTLQEAAISAEDRASYIKQTCTDTAVNYHLVAADGLTLEAARGTDTAVLQPGYRWDALIAFDEPGIYCMIDGGINAGAGIDLSSPGPQLLGYVEVSEDDGSRVYAGKDLTKTLVQAAWQNIDAGIRKDVIGDLKDGLKLTRFLPHESLMDVPAYSVGIQHLAFNIDVSQTPPVFEIDGKPFLANRVDRVLPLGAIEDWVMTSDFVSHPFHIHVNPFQIVQILDPLGKDVSAPDAVDDYNYEDPSKPLPLAKADRNYPGLKGVWKDTLWTKNPSANPGDSWKHGYTVVVRTQYRRYIGDFVLHCHILDHEDQGMMQHIRIALPDGMGGVESAAHGADPHAVHAKDH